MFGIFEKTNGKSILKKLLKTQAGNDLIAIVDCGDLNESYLSIFSPEHNIKIRISKGKSGTWVSYYECNDTYKSVKRYRASHDLIDKSKDLEVLCRNIWLWILSSPFDYSGNRGFRLWLQKKDCSVIGKKLRANEIFKSYIGKGGFYIPGSEIFRDKKWNFLKEKLGMDICYVTRNSTSPANIFFDNGNKIARRLSVFFNPNEGNLKILFSLLCDSYLLSIFSNLSTEEVLYYCTEFHFDTEDLFGNHYTLESSYPLQTKNQISAKTQEEWEELAIKSIINQIISNKLPEDPMRKLMVPLLENKGDIRSAIKEISSSVMNSKESMKILSELRKNCPDVWAIMIGDSEEEKQIGNLGADLGDYGF